MSKHYVPDGQGGFYLEPASYGIGTLFLLGVVGIIMTIPGLIGAVGCLFLFKIFTLFFPNITTTGTMIFFLFLTIAIALVTTPIYAIYFQRSQLLGKVIGAYLVYALYVSPLIALFFSFLLQNP